MRRYFLGVLTVCLSLWSYNVSGQSSAPIPMQSKGSDYTQVGYVSSYPRQILPLCRGNCGPLCPHKRKGTNYWQDYGSGSYAPSYDYGAYGGQVGDYAPYSGGYAPYSGGYVPYDSGYGGGSVPSYTGGYDSGYGGGYGGSYGGAQTYPGTGTDSGTTSSSQSGSDAGAATSPQSGGSTSAFGSAGSGYTAPTSSQASSDLLQGTSSVAGGYGLAGMETFGDMLGNTGNGGSIIEITRETFSDIISFNVEKGISLNIGNDVENNGLHSWSLSGLTMINSETQKRYEGYSTNIVNANAYPYIFDNDTRKFIKNPDYDSAGTPSVTEPTKNGESLRSEALNYVYEKYANEDIEDVNIYGGSGQLWMYYNVKDGARDVFVDEDSNSYFSYDVSAVRLLYSQRAEYRAALSQSVVGRIRISENLSPLPQNRFIFDYNGFHGVPTGAKKFDLQRVTFGMEKALLNNLVSFEARLPMAATLDTNLQSDGNTSFNSLQMGDLSLTFKALLWRNRQIAFTGGVTVTVPTGKDVRYYDSYTGAEVMRYKNDTTHVMPYIGGIWTPNSRWFTQAYAQVDFDASGRSVLARQNANETMKRYGRADDNTYLYTTLACGYWLHRDQYRRYGFTGWNVVGELHWTHALDSSNDVTIRGTNYDFNVGNFTKSYDVLNATIGTRFTFHQNMVLGFAYGLPLSNDKQFDGEFRVSLNHYF